MTLKMRIVNAIIGMILIAISLNIIVNVDIGYGAFDAFSLEVQDIFSVDQFGDAGFLAHMLFVGLLLIFFKLNKIYKYMEILISIISIFALTRLINIFGFITDIDLISQHQYIFFTIGVLVISLGALLVGKSNLIIPPYDKFVAEISEFKKWEIGIVRLVSDSILLIVSIILSFTIGDRFPISVGTIILTFGIGFIMNILDRLLFIRKK